METTGHLHMIEAGKRKQALLGLLRQQRRALAKGLAVNGDMRAALDEADRLADHLQRRIEATL